jgi:hypothetical protein
LWYQGPVWEAGEEESNRRLRVGYREEGTGGWWWRVEMQEDIEAKVRSQAGPRQARVLTALTVLVKVCMTAHLSLCSSVTVVSLMPLSRHKETVLDRLGNLCSVTHPVSGRVGVSTNLILELK